MLDRVVLTWKDPFNSINRISNEMNQQTIFEKILDIESELQKLKLEAYLQLPKKQRGTSKYSERSVLNAVRLSRNRVWQKRYVAA